MFGTPPERPLYVYMCLFTAVIYYISKVYEAHLGIWKDKEHWKSSHACDESLKI
jgi:hypothetical protein